jgi:hypothetical protein
VGYSSVVIAVTRHVTNAPPLVAVPYFSRHRQELLELLDRMNPTIEELTAAVEREARKRPEAMRLMTHPGVGPLTALAYVLIIGTPTRFQRGKQIGTYVGMIQCEASSARKQRLGHISKQGWWKQPKQRPVSIRTGDVGIFTWRCVDTKVLPR